jgi:hypothetical protein
MAGFRGHALGLHLPIRPLSQIKSPKVSAQLGEYSHFPETGFDQHCVAAVAVAYQYFSVKIGSVLA